jgi:hypothetical protein
MFFRNGRTQRFISRIRWFGRIGRECFVPYPGDELVLAELGIAENSQINM